MKLSLFFVVLAFFAVGPLQAAQTLVYKGTLGGKYAIEMELIDQDGKNFTGRYRYQGKTQWLNLKGQLEGPTQSELSLLEYAPDGKNSGKFTIVFEGESLVGSWQKNPPTGKLDVKLMLFDSGQTAAISKTDSSSVKYELEKTVDTTPFPPEHKKEVPVGSLEIARNAEGLKFGLDYNTGYPHYHIAQAAGFAKPNGTNRFRYSQILEGATGACVLDMTVEGAAIRVETTTSSLCQFGAYADPSGRYIKKSK